MEEAPNNSIYLYVVKPLAVQNSVQRTPGHSVLPDQLGTTSRHRAEGKRQLDCGPLHLCRLRPASRRRAAASLRGAAGDFMSDASGPLQTLLYVFALSVLSTTRCFDVISPRPFVIPAKKIRNHAMGDGPSPRDDVAPPPSTDRSIREHRVHPSLLQFSTLHPCATRNRQVQPREACDNGNVQQHCRADALHGGRCVSSRPLR